MVSFTAEEYLSKGKTRPCVIDTSQIIHAVKTHKNSSRESLRDRIKIIYRADEWGTRGLALADKSVLRGIYPVTPYYGDDPEDDWEALI